MTTPDDKLVFVVHNPKTKQVFVFDDHSSALQCRIDQGLTHWWLWGCTTNCYRTLTKYDRGVPAQV